MRKVFIGLASAAALTLLVTVAPARASSSEQVVFSGTGDSSAGPFGNWVWCEAESDNPYAGECNGSIYFYALHLTKHVDGDITESPPESGLYTMTLSSSDGSIQCTLDNTAPAVHGPHNTVDIACSSPSASGSSNREVVNVTGP